MTQPHALARSLALVLTLSASLAACGGGGGGGGNSSDPCDRLSAQCDVCASPRGQTACYQAVNAGIPSSCQQLLDDGTYVANSVECLN